MTKPRKLLAIAALLAAPLLCVTMPGGPAAAAAKAASATTAPAVTQAPRAPTASGCNRRICLEIHVLGKWVFAKAWVRFGPDRFDGHYQLLNPRRNYWNSGPNRVWDHSDPWVANRVSALAGKWCVIGWKYNGGHNYNKIGYPCVTVTLR
jgi:hypothetical protein